MEPIPETTLALAALTRHGAANLPEDLAHITQRALEVVPDLLGMSLTLVAEDITLTYLATSADVAALDAVQYADGGPCETASDAARRIDCDEAALMDESAWQIFASASAASGVRSTLSLPIMDGDVVTSCINLYGSRSTTFEGRQDELATVFGAWAPGVVKNADLSFARRLAAVAAPTRLDDLGTVDRAVDVLAEAHGVSSLAAREILVQAAARAGVPLVAVAHMVLRGASAT